MRVQPATEYVRMQEAWRFDEQRKNSSACCSLIFGCCKFLLFVNDTIAKNFKCLQSLFLTDYSRIVSVALPIPPSVAFDVDFDLYLFGLTSERLRKTFYRRKDNKKDNKHKNVVKHAFNVLIGVLILIDAINYLLCIFVTNEQWLIYMGDAFGFLSDDPKMGHIFRMLFAVGYTNCFVTVLIFNQYSFNQMGMENLFAVMKGIKAPLSASFSEVTELVAFLKFSSIV